jgi:hypothetical protein
MPSLYTRLYKDNQESYLYRHQTIDFQPSTSSTPRAIPSSIPKMHFVAALVSGVAFATNAYGIDSISFMTSSCPDCSHATGCSIETRSNIPPSFGCISMWSGDASLTVFNATNPSCQGVYKTPMISRCVAYSSVLPIFSTKFSVVIRSH